MGKTPSPGKWIKSLLGKKSSKSSLEKGNEKLRSAKKEELVVKVKDTNVADLPTNPQALVSSQHAAIVPDVVVPEKNPSEESNVNLESGNDTEEAKLEEAATMVQAAFRSHQAREEFQRLKGIIKLQAVIRGHLVRRQAVATYSCIWGVVTLQALVRGNKARSSDTIVQLEKTKSETEDSESMQGSRYKWFENPTKLSMIDKLLVSSPNALPLKIQYAPEDPNSAKVWLERWTLLQVWAPGPLLVKSLVAKRSFQTVEADKGKLKNDIKKPPGGSISTAQNEKSKRNVRKASSTVGKEVSRTENDKSNKQCSRKSTSAVKDEKARVSRKKGSLSNGIERHTRKSAEKKKKKEIADTVEKELPGDKVSAPVEEKVKDSPETVSKEADLVKDDKAPVQDDELKTEEEIQEADVQISAENGNTKPSDRRASLPAKIENHHQEDGLTQSGRKIPSYMAPTASAKARVRGGQGSPRIIGQEKNGITRRHSLPNGANGKLNAMSPRAHRLLIASAKGSMNSDRSFSSSKDIGDKSKAEWKR